jgi:hypothetical protein
MKQAEREAEPPSCLQPPIFVIGRDSKGNWVAQEQTGMRGGLFIDRAAALKFAKAESRYDPYIIVWISGVVELDTSAASRAASEHTRVQDGAAHRRAA